MIVSQKFISFLNKCRKPAKIDYNRYGRILSTIPCVVYDYVRWPDGRNQFLFISPQCKDLFEYDVNRILGETDLLWALVHADDLKRLKREDQLANETGEKFQSEVRITVPSGRRKWVQLTSMPSCQEYRSRTIWCGIIKDISERKKIEIENEELLADLQRALSTIKTLEGILPICSFCKKIRDEKGDWQQLEAYISSRSKVDFSHGLCEECARKHYPAFTRELE